MAWSIDPPICFATEDSIGQGIYEICGSNLLITSPDSRVEILLCHESDIHIDGSDDDSIAKIVACFPTLDFRSADEWKSHFKYQSQIEPPKTAR